MPDALRLADVRAGYGETVVIEEIGFSLPERGSLAVLGRNGVGKTSLLATIMGHTTFHSGSIEYHGARIEKLPVYERNRLGVGLVLERVHDLFPALADRRRHWGNQISGGEQQMLAIGRALMGNPALLLMDEPLEGLAPIIVEVLLQALQRLIREDSLAVMLVEQHAKLALEVTQSALVLNRGRIAYSGSSAELLADPRRLTNLVVA
jgi:branched-chain amino acid transport system ATP-binding protein